ncbi:hypothetical protein ASPWEDRAFT_682039 [Aspergillus wentii DTO 134E9]|uniref:Uncharacterized protein n=1 Tax=Aspergillus wentii DTO 134E9 TaxID=1073089 RepID=A0A1L9R8B6_ASPWE|nr:uncharacterized protein ASPWEDRAFT_682039 [Aspergillus wentii DTO 134E9]OJJ31123.1 hypothetical protein ASPWEDRAFT_682039 [Aspergillus wentii DTO 134E9]
MASDEQGCERRQALSFSLALRSPGRKRIGIMRPPTPPPTCEERVHYPVFDPQDPRHNPTASPWYRDGYYISEPSRSPNSVRWMQSLPKRSLRKARSGFLALRSGIQRRPLSHDQVFQRDIPSIWSSSDWGGALFDQPENRPSSTVSEASTEEDFDFGFDLERTKCNCYSLERYLLDPPSSITLTDTAFPPELNMETYGPSSLVSEENTLNNLRQENTADLEKSEESPQKQATEQHDGLIDRTALYNETPNFIASTSPSQSPRRSSIPQITGIQFAMEPLQMFDRTSTDRCQTNGTGHQPHQPQLFLAETLGDSSTEITEIVEDLPSVEEYQLAETQQDALSTEILENNVETQQERRTNASLPSLDHTDSGLAWVGGSSFVEQDNINTHVDHSVRFSDYNEDGTATDISSVSMDPWSPVGNDDLVSLPSVRDEYFLLDKSSDFRPDRGDTPIKTDRRIISDGSLHSGPGLDRNVRAQDIPEIIGPGDFLQRHVSHPGNRLRVERDGSDSTDEYIATYPVFERRHYS